MEAIIEEILGLILEESTNQLGNKKLSKWIRIPLFIFVVLFYTFVIGILMITGILLLEDTIIGSILVFALALFILISTIVRVKKVTGKTDASNQDRENEVH